MNARGVVRMLMIGASVVMLAAIVAGMWVMGSPSHQRALRLDAVRGGNLGMISTRLSMHWHAHKQLPQSLAELTPPFVVKDPVTDQPYVYTTTGPSTYRLCANFDAASEKEGTSFGYIAGASRRWDHASAGQHCFDLNAEGGMQGFSEPETSGP